jgi:glutamate-1-semialdehyde 2,1-aminomutase
MDSITQEYIDKHPRSRALYEKSLQMFPGGVTHDTRYVTPFPTFVTHASGARKWDVDGNEYVCYVMGHGALILGHSHPEIARVVQEQVTKGTHLGANTELELAWADAVKRLVPSVEKIRFHSSGTEATLMAFRIARTFTVKNKIIKFSDHFHGWHDYAVAGPGRYASGGIPKSVEQTMIVLPPGDIGVVEKVLREDKDVAAVILEPTGASGGALPVMPGFLRDLRAVTERYRVLLIFDEVVTGFRTSSGGAQMRFGIRPDLTTMAKILAGGLPGGAVGGRAEILDMIAFKDVPGWNQGRRVAHPGTFNANPLSAAAGSRCLEMIATQPINKRADAAATRLKKGFNEVLARQEVPGFAYGLASLVWVALGKDYDGDLDFCNMPHDQLKTLLARDKILPFKRAMLNNGVDFMTGSEFVVSSEHTDRDVDDTIAAFEKAVAALRREGIV